MIRSVNLLNFKRFETLDLTAAALTVLTGANSGGKSTVLQALLLARQAALSPERDLVVLNGPDLLYLGTASDLIHRQSEADSTTISITEDQPYLWVLEAPLDGGELYAGLRQKPAGYSGVLAQKGFNFNYLCAERLGPRALLPASAEELSSLGVGTQGEYTAQVLDKSSVRVSTRRLAPGFERDEDQGLLPQAEAWMSRVVRPVQIQAEWHPGTTATRLLFRSPGSGEWTRAPNIGFGVSYALPIIVAALRAPEGSLLMVENPEAHLHPAGQSAMGGFLAQVAADGVQVLLETHSDHVLNGIRKAVSEGPGSLAAGDVAIYYFRAEEEPGEPVETLHLLPSGQLSAWPQGFFDQSRLDLAVLARKQQRR